MSAMIERAGGAAVRIPAAKILINGDWHDSADGRMIAVYDPATEEKIAEIVAASVTDVDRAVQAAHRAFESSAWQNMRPLDRGRLLEKLALLIARLPHHQREVWILKQETNLSTRDIAKITHASEEGVKSRLRYATDKLKAGMAGYGQRD